MRPAAAFARLAGLSVLGCVVALAVGWLPTRAVAGAGSVGAMCAGVGIALLAMLIGLVPAVLTLRSPPRERAHGALAGMVVRLMVVVVLLVGALFAGGLGHRVTLAIWTVIGYILLLAVDTIGLNLLLQRAGRSAS